jgi:hypothetical protein
MMPQHILMTGQSSLNTRINGVVSEQSQVRLDMDRSLPLLRDHGTEQRAMSGLG